MISNIGLALFLLLMLFGLSITVREYFNESRIRCYESGYTHYFVITETCSNDKVDVDYLEWRDQ